MTPFSVGDSPSRAAGTTVLAIETGRRPTDATKFLLMVSQGRPFMTCR